MVVKISNFYVQVRRREPEEMVGSSDGHHRIAHFFMSYMLSRCPGSGVVNALFYVLRFCILHQLFPQSFPDQVQVALCCNLVTFPIDI